MANAVKISVKEVIGHDLCVASTDGDKLYDLIVKELEDKSPVTLSFEDIELITSAFLNGAIGRLYDGKISEQTIETLLSYADIERDDEILIEAVIENAKQYFSDPKRYRRAIKDAEEY